MSELEQLLLREGIDVQLVLLSTMVDKTSLIERTNSHIS